MKPSLLILAAGIGSRYGGLKQVEGVGPAGEAILDYSIYDAIKAGFGKIVFVIRKDIKEAIQDVFISKWEDRIEIETVFQELDALPGGYEPPPGRVKPWGTGHAIWVARNKIKEPFAMINADDFYGRQSFKMAEGFLAEIDNLLYGKYCLIGYILKNTLSEHGFVSRAECRTDGHNDLVSITERLKIARREDMVVYEDRGKQVHIDEMTTVSMNMWGFMPSIFEHLEEQMLDFLKVSAGDTKAEFLLPSVIDFLIKTGKAEIPVLRSEEKWFGMTYPEDREMVQEKLRQLAERDVYPIPVWNFKL